MFINLKQNKFQQDIIHIIKERFDLKSDMISTFSIL